MKAFVGTEAVAAGAVTRHQLQTRFHAVHRNVYIPQGHTLSAVEKAHAAWLWSGRRATVAGVSAAALHGSLWIDSRLPAELNQASQHKTRGIVLHADTLAPDEITTVHGIPATNGIRTAFDLGRRKGLTQAVIRLDALMRATKVTSDEVSQFADRHRGARGVVELHHALDLADPGAESPQETRTRLVLTKAGLPPERTQIDVYDREGYHLGRIDMGWPRWKVGVEYDGEHHWTESSQRAHDIDRIAALESQGWRIIRVSADILRHRPATIASRAYVALRAAGAPVAAPSLNL